MGDSKKKSVIIREQFASLFETATDEQAGKLVKAMLAYQQGKEVEFSDPLMIAVFTMLRDGIDQDNAEYEATCERRRQAAKSRWAKGTESESMQEHASASKSIESIANDAEMEMDMDTKKKTSPTESKKKSRAAFTPPTPEEVREYEVQTGLSDEAHAFVDHYTSNGWLVGGKTKMKDWKSARRNWERNKEKFSNRDAPKKEYHNRYNDFPQRNNDYKQIEEEWIRRAFGA